MMTERFIQEFMVWGEYADRQAQN